MTALRKAKGKVSAWVRRNKREFLYSPVLREWEKAVDSGAADDIDRLAARHARQFGYDR